MNTNQANGTMKLSLDGELTIYTALDAKQRLLTCLAQGEAVEADLREVSEFDSAGLQILLLARSEALRAGKRLHWVGFSRVIKEVLALYRLESLFDVSCPSATGAQS